MERAVSEDSYDSKVGTVRRDTSSVLMSLFIDERNSIRLN